MPRATASEFNQWTCRYTRAGFIIPVGGCCSSLPVNFFLRVSGEWLLYVYTYQLVGYSRKSGGLHVEVEFKHSLAILEITLVELFFR